MYYDKRIAVTLYLICVWEYSRARVYALLNKHASFDNQLGNQASPIIAYAKLSTLTTYRMTACVSDNSAIYHN